MQENTEKDYYVLVLLKWEEPTRVQQISHNQLEASAGSAGSVKLHHLHPFKNVDGYATRVVSLLLFGWDTFTGK